MNKKVFVVCVAALIVMSVAMSGCKGKVENTAEGTNTEMAEIVSQSDAALSSQQVVAEPAQNVATETIPPTAQPQMAQKVTPAAKEMSDRNMDIQKALKNAGFYSGAIDGKVGPRTKNAILEFQKAKGLKADGKVGPKTWVELEKYLAQ